MTVFFTGMYVYGFILQILVKLTKRDLPVPVDL